MLSAFLQGDETQGEPLYMKPPDIGLPGVPQDCILRLKRPVYGRPDAPRAWYEKISGYLVDQLGFECSILDPALFVHRNPETSAPDGMLILHVDDLLVCTNGDAHVESLVKQLFDRFPFGEWEKVCDVPSGVSYCGKEVLVDVENGERVIKLRQRGFVDGRLELIGVDNQRKKCLDDAATPSEISDYRSVVGSLQWIASQTRPDLAFLVNQLQKRVGKLQVRDLLEANKAVRIARSHETSLTFRNLGDDIAVVGWSDAGLFNSIGVELDEADDDLVLSLGSKKMLYSQKGCIVGIAKRTDLDRTSEVPVNILESWVGSPRRTGESLRALLRRKLMLP